MRIGVYFTPNKEQGGVYQYSLAILEALGKIPGNKYVIINTSKDVPRKFYQHINFTIIDLHSHARDLAMKARDAGSYAISLVAPKLINLLYHSKSFGLITPLYKLTDRLLIKTIETQNLDLVFYPTSSNLSFLAAPAAVVTVHDLQHRLNPRFKEVSAGGRWEHREYGFQNICKKAFRILVDSEIGKKDIIKYYHPLSNTVISLPYLPPTYLNTHLSRKQLAQTKVELSLPDKFLYYPAKFWPHKNHLNLIKALNILKKREIAIPLVLTGSKEADFSSFNDVMTLVTKYKLESEVKYLGYLEENNLSAIYKMASALIMPTYFGPTNIPVLEAWAMGTPVIYSDIHGCREQLGNAGILINPDDPKDIANKIDFLLSHNSLKKKLIMRGKRRLKLWTKYDFNKVIRQIINDFAKLRANERQNY